MHTAIKPCIYHLVSEHTLCETEKQKKIQVEKKPTPRSLACNGLMANLTQTPPPPLVLWIVILDENKRKSCILYIFSTVLANDRQ